MTPSLTLHGAQPSPRHLTVIRPNRTRSIARVAAARASAAPKARRAPERRVTTTARTGNMWKMTRTITRHSKQVLEQLRNLRTAPRPRSTRREDITTNTSMVVRKGTRRSFSTNPLNTQRTRGAKPIAMHRTGENGRPETTTTSTTMTVRNRLREVLKVPSLDRLRVACGRAMYRVSTMTNHHDRASHTTVSVELERTRKIRRVLLNAAMATCSNLRTTFRSVGRNGVVSSSNRPCLVCNSRKGTMKLQPQESNRSF